MNSIRIVELPNCKAVTSGYAVNEAPFQQGGKLLNFMDWWTQYDKQRTDRWFPRDFTMYGREQDALIWFYAVADDANITCEYDVVDFEGGLYAAGVAIDGDDKDGQTVYGNIKAWVQSSDHFELDERQGHYDLAHVITPQHVIDAMGYGQLEIYVPIKLKTK